MRITGKDALQAILQASGRSHDGVRWFTEIKDKQLLPDQPGEVLWIEWKEGEDWQDYIARAIRETKHGLVRGRHHQLGHRVHRTDARWKPTAAPWRLQKVPKDWEVANAEEAAIQMGFEDVQVLRKGRQRMSSTWTFQAKRNDTLEFVSSELAGTGEEESPWDIFAIKEVRRRAAYQCRALKPERTVHYASPWADLLEERDVHNEGQDESPDIAMEVKGSDPSRSNKEHEQPRDRSRSPKKGTEKELQEPTKSSRSLHGGKIIPNPGQGDCLYHSFSHALNRVDSQTRTHRQLRTLRKKKDVYEARWLRTDDRGNPTNMSFDEYIDLQGKAGSWAGALEAEALATALKRKLWICTSSTVFLFNEEGASPPCVFQFGNGHFENVVHGF